jgi:hypothetical protein
MAISVPSGKEIVDLIKGAITIEAQEKIMQLREAALALQEENLQLRRQLRDAEHKLEIRALTFEGGVYWKDSPPARRGGPFCQPCCDVQNKVVRLHDYLNSYAGSPEGTRIWHCYNCNNDFPQS